MFVHLHSHSCFSFLEGVSTPAQLVQAAKNQGMPALALTDHRSMTGAVEFYDACRAAGVKPLLGLEIETSLPVKFSPLPKDLLDGKLVLLAKDVSGWSSLCRLSSAAQNEAASPPDRPITFEQLSRNSRGLLCLTGGIDGLLSRLVSQNRDDSALSWLAALGEVFPNRLYVQLYRHTSADEAALYRLLRLAQQVKLPGVATHNIYYTHKTQADIQRLVAGIRLNKPITRLNQSSLAPPQAYFPGTADMQARFYHYPQALAASMEITQRCNLELPLGQTHYPEIDLGNNQAPIQFLKAQVLKGARERYQDLSPEIIRRLEHEIKVIETSGYTPLFLIMRDIVQFTRQNGIPISSRGSAASSLVAHCLGITDPDPVRLNLYFERFLNPARATPPDIDTDLCSRRRDEVIQFVYQRFGTERVAMVSTINRFRRRSALREVAKAHGLPPEDVRKLADHLPHRWYGPSRRDAQNDDSYSELTRRFSAPHYQQIFSDAQILLGLPHHLSIHPGGMVIAPGPITDLAPTQMTNKGILVTQFDLESIERLGLVKIDLLGIRGLSVLGDVADEMYRKEKGGVSSSIDLLDSIQVDDPETAQLVRNGLTIGCFQIESPGMRATLKEVKAQDIDDVMVALALYRPGPLTGGLKDAFVRRHKGQEPAAYLHPSLQPLLEETHGVILYQEQVLRIAHELGGFSLSEADLLRRAMSHFDPGKQMVTLKEKFLSGALERFHVPEESAVRIWDMMAAFAGYGFPKAHAASYAQVAWRSAYCKTHYPGPFMAAVLANWGGYYRQSVYLTEARRLGLSIQPPLVNHAGAEFSLRYIDGVESLITGLNQVRELTRQTVSRIQKLRPFGSLPDFLSRVDPRPVEAENLIKVGALHGLGTIPGMLRKVSAKNWRKGQLSLFAEEPQMGEDWSPAQISAAQESILGVSVSTHPLDLYSQQISRAGCLSTIEAAAKPGQRVRIAGLRQTWRRGSASQSGYIYFMSLEDLEGIINVLIDSDIYRAHRKEFTGTGPYIIEGIIEKDLSRAEPILRAKEIWNIS
jgi:DNA-directed DNA polymerase III PolC